MLWVGKGDEAKTPGSLSLPVLDNNHLRDRPKAAEVVFECLLIGVEVEASHEELPFFRRHGTRQILEGKCVEIGENSDCGRGDKSKHLKTGNSRQHKKLLKGKKSNGKRLGSGKGGNQQARASLSAI